VHDLIEKLNQGFKMSNNNNPIVEFDNNSYLKGIEYFGQLYNAILYKKVLQINYQPFGSIEIEQLRFHPYYLKQFNNRWFLFGYSEASQKYDWNLALDRIIDLNELDTEYKQNTSIDWSEYFEDIVGVTKPVGKDAENIVLHFYGNN
jgi:predicted DNA-binding transcriptional regulator YafY